MESRQFIFMIIPRVFVQKKSQKRCACTRLANECHLVIIRLHYAALVAIKKMTKCNVVSMRSFNMLSNPYPTITEMEGH